jgi:signal transduction histidine kinase
MATNIVTARQESGNVKREELVQTIATLSGSINHELKNHLATINICAELLEGNLAAIRKTVNVANCFMDNIQLQIKGIIAEKPSSEDFKICSISKNIEEVLEQYPFKTGERNLIIIEAVKDFKYRGSAILTTHIFYNLIRNSLRAIVNAGKGEIIIKLEFNEKFNRLIFRDTASGIKKEFLPKIFKLFASQTTEQGGTGVGLAYCMEIMQAYGGGITCDSIAGEYTEFVLNFPLL